MSKLVVSCIRGGLAGRRWEFDGKPFTIGRSQTNDLALDPTQDRKASSRHAEVKRTGDQWTLTDLQSTNGTFVAGKTIREIVLTDGLDVEIGQDGPILRFRVGPTQRTGELPTESVKAVRRPIELSELQPESSGRTAVYRAMMVEAVEQSSSHLKKWIALLATILVLAGIGIWLYIRSSTAETEALQQKADDAQEAAERLTARTSELEVELEDSGAAADEIAARATPALFMLIADKPAGPEGFCTAFALSTDGLLGTNAHCARSMATYADKGIDTLARMNRAPDKTYRVVKRKSHPDYDDTPFSRDVAVVRLAMDGDTLPIALQLASEADLLKLAAGNTVFTMGFPGKVMNEDRPAADFRAAVISRLTTFKNTPGDPASSYVVWHSALTSKGTSGSPIFNARGLVIAVNNGGLSARKVLTRDASGALKEDFAYDATGLNFGIRADTLRTLLQ